MKKDSAPPEDIPPRPAPDEEIEEAHYDEATLGKALRWSLAILAVLIIAGVILFLSLKPAPPPPEENITQLTAPQLRQVETATPPTLQFTIINEVAGIDFVHENGAYGEKLLPETMGSGVAFLDFDNDNDQDLLFINGAAWPGQPVETPSTMALYANDGSGVFENVTANSGLDVSVYGVGVAIGDYDGDGLDDVFVTAVGTNRLFKNLGGGKFQDVTDAAGAGGGANEWSSSAAFLDYDNDGDLDLFVCNYVRWSRQIDLEVDYRLVGVGRAYGPPMNFAGTFPYLYQNNGDGTFADVSEAAGLHVLNRSTGSPVAKSLGVSPADIDQDGWIDIIVANDTVPNFLFHNQKNGQFKEIGALAGVAFDSYGMTRGAMGIDTGYFRNDASLGIGIANFANEMSALFVSQDSPTVFVDEAIPEGIGPAGRLLLKFGFFFFDYDLDGRLDVLTSNGHLEEEITMVQESQHYEQPAQLFWNGGGANSSTFIPVGADKAGADLFEPIVGRGSAYGDLDNDGDLDVVMTQVAGPPLVLRNDQALGHSWIRFKLKGTTSNPNAIGALIRVETPEGIITRQVMPTRSYLSQSELPVTIGLGELTAVEQVDILWPSGAKQTLKNPPLNRMTVIEEQQDDGAQGR